MNGEAIFAIRDLSAGPEVLEIDGRKLVTVPAGDGKYSAPVDVCEIKAPTASPIELHTLRGLADYVIENRDGLELARCVVRVKSPGRVDVFGPLAPASGGRVRETFAYAAAPAESFTFGQFFELDAFVIALLSQFAPSGDRDAVLRLLGNVKESAVKQWADDGVTQSVEAKTGIIREEVPVPNPVNLAPFRTFPEVDPPVSPFVLRLQAGRNGGKPTAALFEADGGRWKLEAMARIRAWLDHALSGDGPESAIAILG